MGGKSINQRIKDKVSKDGAVMVEKRAKRFQDNHAKVREASDQAEVDSEVITKKCTKCSEVKALDAFSADKRAKDGKQCTCKGCARKYRQENKGRISERSRKYYEENKEDKSEYQRKYRQENKERIIERERKYRQENPEVNRRALRKRRALLRNLPHQPLTPQQYEILHRQKYEIFGGNAIGN